MKEKLIASFLAALMAMVTTVSPVLAATALKDFPTFLGVDGTPDFYVVVGAAAATADVVGAIDVATRLAELSYTEEVVPGAVLAAVEGKESDDTAFGTAINSDGLGATLTKTQVPLLSRGEVTYDTTKYGMRESITVPDAQIKHDKVLNGTIYLDIGAATTLLKYTYEFVKPFDKAPSVTEPLEISLLGQEFKIMEFNATYFVALTGISGTATATSAVTYGDYSLYSDLGANDPDGWARIIIKDATGNTVDTLIIDSGESDDSTAADLTISITKVRALTDGTIVGVDLVVGPEGEVEKKYETGDNFLDTELWQFDLDISAAQIDSIALKYVVPNETYSYLKVGEKIVAPNDYFELGFRDLAVSEFATLTISTGKVTIYDSTGTTKTTAELPAIIVTSDVPVFGGEVFKKAYIAYNTTGGQEKLYLAYYDESLEKAIHQGDNSTFSYCSDINTPAPGGIIFSGTFDRHDFTLTYDNATSGYPACTAVDTANPLPAPAELTIDVMDTDDIIPWFTYDSTYKKFILGSEEREAEAADVKIGASTEGTYEFDIVLDKGTTVKNIKAKADVEKVVIELPADQQKGIVYVGKLGEEVTEEQTYHKMKGITASVAVLDSEVTSVHKAKNIVTVGGPCANTITAELADAGKLLDKDGVELTCTNWNALTRQFGIISAIDDGFVTGKVALVVAGSTRDETRTACSALQNYGTKLAGVTSGTVEVSTTGVVTVV